MRLKRAGGVKIQQTDHNDLSVVNVKLNSIYRFLLRPFLLVVDSFLRIERMA